TRPLRGIDVVSHSRLMRSPKTADTDSAITQPRPSFNGNVRAGLESGGRLVAGLVGHALPSFAELCPELGIDLIAGLLFAHHLLRHIISLRAGQGGRPHLD